jgi:HD-GYP domain-containing protein (c-di-GMP phosphodiesterase class II)
MIIRMDQLVRAISSALDIIEGELLGASTHHGKRIGILCAAMGRKLGMDELSLSVLVTCALFHDSALTEYIFAEKEGGAPALKMHCEAGQRNVEDLLCPAALEGFVLYHHERADGSGIFGKKEGEFPREAALIAIADTLDVAHHLQRVPLEALSAIHLEIKRKTGAQFTHEAAEALLAVLDQEMLASLRDERIFQTACTVLPVWTATAGDRTVFCLAALIARVIDYKSVFTRRHSEQIAHRAWLMGSYYGYDTDALMAFYLAAALHDIGKLAVPTAILEKPGSLDEHEFALMKAHVRKTFEILKDIEGFEYICTVASSHHEKLDGSGYPFGKEAAELDFNARLLACIDIYQAVCEERPYHAERSHEQTMAILYDMAARGFIDKTIVTDLDTVMCRASELMALPIPQAPRD